MTLNEFIENEIKSGYVTNRYEFRQYVESVEILSGSSYQLVTSWHDEYLDYEVMQVHKHISYISDFMMDYELVLKKNTEKAEQFNSLRNDVNIINDLSRKIDVLENRLNGKVDVLANCCINPIDWKKQ